MDIRRLTGLTLTVFIAVLALGCATPPDSPPPTRTTGADGGEQVAGVPLYPPEPNRADQRAAQQAAIQEMLAASRSDNPFIRSNAIETAALVPGRALPLVQKGLTDRAAVVRFTSAATAARLGHRSLLPAIRQMKTDTNPSVRAAAIVADHMLAGDERGPDRDMSRLAAYLASDDAALRANVAMLLGMAGDPTAIPLLKQASTEMPRGVAAERTLVTQVQIAEAIAQLGGEAGFETLRANVFNEIGEVRVLAITAIGAVGDERGAGPLQTLLMNDPQTGQPRGRIEVRLAAAGALARIAGKDRLQYPSMREWLARARIRGQLVTKDYLTHKNPAIRAQATWNHGWFVGAESFAALRAMLKDPDPSVRIAAAAAILRRTGG